MKRRDPTRCTFLRGPIREWRKNTQVRGYTERGGVTAWAKTKKKLLSEPSNDLSAPSSTSVRRSQSAGPITVDEKQQLMDRLGLLGRRGCCHKLYKQGSLQNDQKCPTVLKSSSSPVLRRDLDLSTASSSPEPSPDPGRRLLRLILAVPAPPAHGVRRCQRRGDAAADPDADAAGVVVAASDFTVAAQRPPPLFLRGTCVLVDLAASSHTRTHAHTHNGLWVKGRARLLSQLVTLLGPRQKFLTVPLLLAAAPLGRTLLAPSCSCT